MYIDGEFNVESTQEVSLGFGYGDHRLTSTSSEFKIAQNRDNSLDNNFKFNGGIDEIRLYNSTLSATSVAQLYDLTQRDPKLFYVDAFASGANNGSSWADALTNLSDALDSAAQFGDTVFVAAGTYYPGNTNQSYSVNNTFSIKDGVKIFGGFSGTETLISERLVGQNETILSGDFNDDDQAVGFNESSRSENAYNVITPGKNVTIDGFTIKDGNAVLTTDPSKRTGAAIVRIHQSSNGGDTLMVKNCIIKNNVAWAQAGGIYCDFQPGAANENCALIIENCEFYNNVSTVGAAVSIANRSLGTTNLVQENCLYHSNRIEDFETSRLGLSGSAMFLFSITDGGVLNSTFTNLTIAQNVSNGTGAGIPAPIAYRVNSTNAVLNLDVRNSIIKEANNESSFGLQSNGSSQKMDDLTIRNTRITETSFSNESKNPSSNNLTSAQPIFADMLGGDYSLTDANSNLIDAGNNTYVSSAIDLANDTRIYNNVVDLGAFEFQGTTSSEELIVGNLNIIYPNPAQNFIVTEKGDISIFDLNGKLVLQTQSVGIVDISTLNNGTYLVHSNSSTSKFIVVK